MIEEKQHKFSITHAMLLFFIIFLLICTILIFIFQKSLWKNTEKIDDWQYSASNDNSSGTSSNSYFSPGSISTDSSLNGFTSSSQNSSIGFSTGGSKDVNNFRENIENNYFPISTDITYNGLFYDYYFDTGKTNESTELFSPSYSTAVSKDPISDTKEYYLTVGLNSNIKESDFSRKKLNLVVVLDISGSMNSSFSSYYYDSDLDSEKNATKTKMQIANESVNILIDQLNDDDRFGMVLFDNSSYIGKPLNLVGQTDINAIKNHILEISAHGGTNFERGYTTATTLFDNYTNINSDEYENRIIVITDAMPNYGTTSEQGLLSYVNDNAKNGIYTTFIGVGIDFNTELIEQISNVKGSNYYSVHNSEEFKSRMGEQFEYMVTPLVFDLKLNLTSDDYEIEMVYGSDTVNKKNGNIMNINTLFPSKSTNSGEVKGGIVLLKLSKNTENGSGTLELNVSYRDRNGNNHSNSQNVIFDNTQEHYENTGIRKSILLTRYVNTLKNWILYERTENSDFMILPSNGILDCYLSREDVYKILGEHERTSVKLTVSNDYKNIFTLLKNYIKSENIYLEDETLDQEIQLLDKLINY